MTVSQIPHKQFAMLRKFKIHLVKIGVMFYFQSFKFNRSKNQKILKEINKEEALL